MPYSLHRSLCRTILVAPFVDIATLVATYRIRGILPILSPFARYSPPFKYLFSLIRDRWQRFNRIVGYVRTNEAKEQRYPLTLIHADDDYEIPWRHTVSHSHRADLLTCCQHYRVTRDQLQ